MTQKRFASLYITCQSGAEQTLKREISRNYPALRFSYSRGPFSTWLFQPDLFRPLDLETIKPLSRNGTNIKGGSNNRLIDSVFARSCTLSIGKVGRSAPAPEPAGMVSDFWREAELAMTAAQGTKWFARGVQHVHVWEPDPNRAGTERFEPGQSPQARELQRAIIESCPDDMKQRFGISDQIGMTDQAYLGDVCLDCIVVKPNEWWLGTHRVVDEHSRWPGGLLPLELPHDAVSRAWLKFEEGLRWSGFPIGPGSRCIDIGSSPGGGSQALLARGAEVIGVDPAEMALPVLNHPGLTHARGKINQLKRKLFRKSRWILADMNVAPAYTLAAVEELVLRNDLRISGLLFTLKLFDWKLADAIPDHIQRIRSWGFRNVRVRQLQFNRQEVMVAAVRK